MELKINLNDENIKIDTIKFQKMILIYNALEEGWSIKKKEDSFIFSKKHEGKREVLLDSYLNNFMKTNLDVNKIIS